jgi:hypothetical protein
MQATGTDRSGVVHTLAACAYELNTGIFQHPYQAPLGTLLTFDKGGRIGPGRARVQSDPQFMLPWGNLSRWDEGSFASHVPYRHLSELNTCIFQSS